jgi:NAD-dependent dihydropyrimidine dehydrogenase PreA subunit
MERRNRTRRRTSHNQTKFIRLDSHLCEACWKCIDACSNGVIGKIDMLFGLHKHAQIKQPDLCKGCKKCVQTCSTNALVYTYHLQPNP